MNRLICMAAAVAIVAALPTPTMAQFITHGPVPETPDATYAEMVACLAEKGAFKMPLAERDVVKEDCISNVKGLTVFEFLAMLDGCVMIGPMAISPPKDFEQAFAYCDSGIEKLRPQFVKGGPPPSAGGLTAAEFVAIESGGPLITDGEKARCLSGVNKLKSLLLVGAGEQPLVSRDSPGATTEEYLAWVKAAPTWINAPGGNALWLRDPLGQLVRDKKGNPIAVPFDKPAPAH
jgi:hypothetical protein